MFSSAVRPGSRFSLLQVKVVAPGQTPKRGKGGSAASRQALLHSLCHIENWAVDLSWDVIARFGSQADYELPREFFDDFVTVGQSCHTYKLIFMAMIPDIPHLCHCHLPLIAVLTYMTYM